MKMPQDCQSLEEVRSAIDQLDQVIIEVISQRRAYVHAAMDFKRSELDVYALQRQQQMLAARRLWAAERDLDSAFIESLFRLMVDHFIAEELAMLGQEDR